MIQTKLSSILNNLITPLQAQSSIEEALNEMKNNAISSIVVVDEIGKPIGIFTEHDALKIIANKKNKSTKLESIMTKNVFCVDEDMYIHDAYVFMEEKSFKHLVVVDKNEIYLGVVTEGDFLRNIGFDEIGKFKLIEETMSKSILTVKIDTLLIEVAKLMTEKRCDYAIVEEDNKPLSIVNERDLAHYYSNNKNTKNATVSVIKNNSLYLIKRKASLQEAYDIMKQYNLHQLVVINDDDTIYGLITRHDVLKAIHGSYFEFLLRTIESKSAKEEELLNHKQELERLANYDLLTGLPNRSLFKTYLKKSISRTIRNKTTSAVLVIDLDDFNAVNDSYGHTIGDELLKKISIRLQERVRDGDVVARISGDEFGIILEQISSKNGVAKATEEILENLSLPFELQNSIEVHIKASVGIVMTPNDAENIEEVLQFADNALSRSKKDRDSGYKFYTNQMTIDTIKRLECEKKLRDSIKKKQLEVYYQPQVHIKTGKIVGAEALLRWNDPTRGIISPVEFIPIAEDSGLINEIGEWVLNEVCLQGKKWLDKGYRLSLAVNVSANQIKYQNLPSIVDKALQRSNFSAEKLELELTESSIMQTGEETTEMLHILRAKGITLAIDDFGTGYSSLAYLKKFPIDILKIDKSFIDDLPYANDDIAIVTAIIEMGKALGYQVLAEGTENKDQIDFLKEKGCEFYQGFYKSKPLPVKEFEDMLSHAMACEN
ncbi:EAL domain-containing protein [Sulfurimonas sp.]